LRVTLVTRASGLVLIRDDVHHVQPPGTGRGFVNHPKRITDGEGRHSRADSTPLEELPPSHFPFHNGHPPLYFSFRISSRSTKKTLTTERTETTEKVLLFVQVGITVP
jgi:hypothetical protein